jgi:hypothetical protein
LRRGAVCQVDFLPPTVDGRAPITRLAARIDELRAAGHVIASAGWRHKTRVYVLEREAGHAAAPTAAAVPSAPDALFAEGVGAAPPRSAYSEVHG